MRDKRVPREVKESKDEPKYDPSNPWNV